MEPQDALRSWEVKGPIRTSPDAGNINRTYEVGDPPRAILQWVNPIFQPEIDLDIQDAVSRLKAAGLSAPALLPTRTGPLWITDPGGGHWRLSEFLPGRTLHKLDGPERAFEAGAYVGRFHQALAGWAHTFRAPRLGVHDTLRHMAFLDDTLARVIEHPMRARVAPLGREILAAWSGWTGVLDLPERIAHGDLKVSNLRFAAEGDAVSGILDLDTLTWFPYAVEMGDAWRSWCNPATEEDLLATRFDVRLFEASLEGWLAHAPSLAEVECRTLVSGIERICIELAARFCADALNNRYFREDRTRFPEVGAHCLQRAQAQLRLGRAVRDQAVDLETIVARLAR